MNRPLMVSEVCLFVKCFVAHFALIWLVTRVNPFMFDKVMLIVEFLVTEWTLELLLSDVSPSVFLVRTSVTETFGAERALERFVSRVKGSNMSLEGALGAELLFAVGADESHFVACFYVPIQIVLRNKTTGAQMTLKGFDIVVFPQMSVHLFVVVPACPAEDANYWFFKDEAGLCYDDVLLSYFLFCQRPS